MRYILLLSAVLFVTACSSSTKSDPLFQFQAPAITDQEFTDGIPAYGDEYGREISYEAQIKSDGGTYIKGTNKSTTRTKSTQAK